MHVLGLEKKAQKTEMKFKNQDIQELSKKKKYIMQSIQKWQSQIPCYKTLH